MADAGGTEVARISVRVVPKLKGFRQKVKKEAKRAAKEASGENIEFQGEVDARKTRGEAKKAAKAASGEDVDFDPNLPSRRLVNQARQIAREASGHKVNFGVDIDRSGLRGLRESLAKGFSTVSTDRSGVRLFDNRALIQARRQVAHITQGLQKIRRAGSDLFEPVTRGVKFFGRTARQATRAVHSGLYDGWRAGLYRVVEGFADARQAGKRFDREVIVPLQAGLQNLGGRGLDQLRKAGFGDRIEHTMLRARAEMDRLRIGTKRFADEWMPQHRFGDRLAMAVQGARAEMDHMRESTRRFGRTFADTDMGRQLDQSLLRARGKAAELRQTIREIGNSDEFHKLGVKAENFARKLRNIQLGGASAPRTRGPWTADMSSATRGMQGFNKETKKADASLSRLIGKIPLIGRAFGKNDKQAGGFFKNLRQKYFQPDSTIGFIVAAVAALIAPIVGLVGSLMAGLPTLLASIGAAAGVVALGFQGIKDSIQPLSDAIGPLRDELSATFRENLTPQFEKLAGILPQIAPGLDAIAVGMTRMSGAVIDAVMMPANIEKLNGFLDKTASLFSDMAPGFASFTDGFLTMFDGAAAGFPAMAKVFNDFAELFSMDMSRLVDTGAMEAAMNSLADVTGSLMTNLHEILVAGVELMPSVAPGLMALFEGFSEGLIKALPALATFSNFAGEVIGGLAIHIGDVLQAIGPSMSRMFGSLGRMFTSFFEAVGPTMVSLADTLASSFAGIFEALEPAIARLSPVIADIVGKLGNGLADVLDGMVASGTIDTLVSSLTNLAGVIGDSLLSIIEQVLPLLPSFADSLAQLMASLAEGSAEGLMQLATEAIPVMIEGLQVLIPLLEIVVDLLSVISPEVIGSAIKDMVGQVTGLGPAMEGFSWVKGLFSDTSDEIVGAGDSATDAIPKFEGLSTSVSGIATSAAGANTAISGIGTAAQGVVDPVEESARRIGESFLQTAVPGFRQATEEMHQAGIDLGTNMAGVALQMPGATEPIKTEFFGLPPMARETTSEMTSILGEGLSGFADITPDISGPISMEMGRVNSSVSTAMSTLSSSVSTGASEAATGVQTGLAPMAGHVTTAGAEMTTQATTSMTNMNAAFQTGVDNAGAIASTLVPTVQGAIGNTNALHGSGLALGNSFAAGIRASIPNARAAAAELAGAVSDNMPRSPAKEGPLSGRGYTTYSGEALVRDLAGGMNGSRHYVRNAADNVADDIKAGIEQYQKDLGNYHESTVLDPILDANARKIHDFNKREREMLEKGNADLEKIAEDRRKMMESLEVPDFREINTSVQSFYIDGTKKMFQKGLAQSAKDANLAGQLRAATLDAIDQAREVLGSHPFMDNIEANVNADHFAWAVQKAVEESEIAYIPIELGIANLDQFKSDLGIGDGALSRAVTAAMEWNPNETDARRFEKEKPEVHYHVADMQEAMRLEEERRRRGALRYI